jgi:uncharacterized protein
VAENVTPRILNFQAVLPEPNEPCAPDVLYFPGEDGSGVAFDSNTLLAIEMSPAQFDRAQREGIESPVPIFFSKHAPKFTLNADTSCRQLTLHLSDQCNLRCSYCWIKPGESPAVMTPEIAGAALSMFPHDGRDLRIGFFGGEPLMHFDLLRKIVDIAWTHVYWNLKPAACHFHVTTNGTLITKQMADFLAARGFSIIVSCDGPEKIHDAARGQGSHAAMLRGLELLRDAGCSNRVVLRGTWTGTPARLCARLLALNDMCTEGLAAGVALEPAAGAPYGDALDGEIRDACNCFAMQGRSRAAPRCAPRWQYLEKTLSRILWQQWRATECGAGRGYYTVGPTGAIYACHKQQNSQIGRIVSDRPIVDETARAKWLDNRFCARRECSLCWARHVCGGACRSESLEFCGSVSKPHAGRCAMMRRLVAESLRLAAALPRETLLKICPALQFKDSREGE